MTKNELELELTEKLNELQKQLIEQDIEEGSLEMYLLNHVNKFLNSLMEAASAQDVDNAASIFSRFCTESMDWDMPLYKQCTAITDRGFKLAKVF